LNGLILLAALAAGKAMAGDAAAGEAVYSRCLGCHAIEYNRTGPKHCGVVGRKAGTVPGFEYSPAMKRSTLVWDEKTLQRFLADPLKTVPGTTMTYAGVPSSEDRTNLVAYLKGQTCK
jgi:cytochrome c